MTHDVKTLRATTGIKRRFQNKIYVPVAYGSKNHSNEFLLYFYENITSYRMIPLTHSYNDNPTATHKLYVHPTNKEITVAARVLIKELKMSGGKK